MQGAQDAGCDAGRGQPNRRHFEADSNDLAPRQGVGRPSVSCSPRADARVTGEGPRQNSDSGDVFVQKGRPRGSQRPHPSARRCRLHGAAVRSGLQVVSMIEATFRAPSATDRRDLPRTKCHGWRLRAPLRGPRRRSPARGAAPDRSARAVTAVARGHPRTRPGLASSSASEYQTPQARCRSSSSAVSCSAARGTPHAAGFRARLSPASRHGVDDAAPV